MNFELKVPKMQLQTNSEIYHLNVSFDRIHSAICDLESLLITTVALQ